MKLSVVLSVLNEEENLDSVLTSVSWADEIIIVDNGSCDKTIEIARKYNAIIIKSTNNLMLNKNKNLGFSHAKGDYILNLDGDEIVEKELKDEIIEILKSNNDTAGWWIKRKNIIFGKWIKHGLWWPDKQLRLFKKNLGKFDEKHIHEYINVKGKTQDLNSCLIHYNYKNIYQYINKLNNIYTESELINLHSQKKQFEWTDILLKPTQDFVKIYFLQECFKDGLHGLILASLQAFYTFVLYVKLWEKLGAKNIDISLKEFNTEKIKINKLFIYWQYQMLINQSSNLKKVFFKLIRKLTLIFN